MADNDVFEFSVTLQDEGMRLDAFAASRLQNCSRSYSALLIRQGRITVDAIERKPSYKIKCQERVLAKLPEPKPVDLAAEPMALDALFEDDCIIVINKPAGMVVHPAAGHPTGTMVNGLLYRCPDLEGIGGERRPGIVHRLDKDTSGVIVVAKTVLAHHELSRQFKDRNIGKQYLALVYGTPEKQGGRIDLPVGRHPVDRKRMSTVSRKGREALTLWQVKEQFVGAALLEVDLRTGRTHQIRVHFESMGHPLVGDPVYGKAGRHLNRLARAHPATHEVLRQASRQMLHAARLRIHHPASGRELTFNAPVPQDMSRILSGLRHRSQH